MVFFKQGAGFKIVTIVSAAISLPKISIDKIVFKN